LRPDPSIETDRKIGKKLGPAFQYEPSPTSGELAFAAECLDTVHPGLVSHMSPL
jgi:hypothetical protein